MNITTVKNKVNLRTIRLKPEEETKVFSLLMTLNSDVKEGLKNSIKMELFDVFEKHFDDKALKAKKYTFVDDFRQKMFLTFFELLEKVKNQELLPEEFLKQLDSIKPDKETVDLAHRRDTVSINGQLPTKKWIEDLT